MPEIPTVVPDLRRRLAVRLALAFGSTSGLVLTVALLLCLRISEGAALQVHQGYASELARVLARGSKAGILEAVGTADAWARRLGRGQLASGAISEQGDSSDRLREILETHVMLQSAAVIWTGKPGASRRARRTSQGIVVDPLPADEVSQEWCRAPLERGHSEWSPPRQESVGDRVVTYAVPIREDGRVVGVLAVDLSLEAFGDAVHPLPPEARGYVLLVDPSDEPLAGPGPLSQSLPSSLIKTIRSSREGSWRGPDPWRQTQSLIVWSTVPGMRVIIVVVVFEEDVLHTSRLVRQAFLGTAVLGLVVLLAVVSLVARSVSRPTEVLLNSVRRVTGGDWSVSMMPDLKTQDETAALSSAFNLMMRELRHQMAEVARVSAEQERMQREIQIASEIQRAFLPRQAPEHPGVVLYGHSEQALQVGGDFYDYFALEGRRVVVAVGDACGEGIPAALFAAMSMTLLRTHMRACGSPAVTLERANALLADDNPTMMFTTVFLGVLDLDRGTLTYSNAGHPSPIRRSRDGALSVVEAPPQSLLGIVDDARYTEHVVPWLPGERLVLFTDGAFEAYNQGGEAYGIGRLERIVALGGSPSALAEALDKDLRAFAPGPRQDDTTVLVVDRVGHDLALSNDLAEIARLESWLDDLKLEVPPSIRKDLSLVLEEYLVNLIQHGGARDIRVTVAPRGEEIWAQVEDGGQAFDPRQARPVPEPDQLGGRGLLLIQAKAEELCYRSQGGRNLLTFRIRRG